MKTNTEKCTGATIAKLLCKESLQKEILQDIEKEQTDKYIKIKNQLSNEPGQHNIKEIILHIEKAREATKRAEATHAQGKNPVAEALKLVMTRLKIKELIKAITPEEVQTFLNLINNN